MKLGIQLIMSSLLSVCVMLIQLLIIALSECLSGVTREAIADYILKLYMVDSSHILILEDQHNDGAGAMARKKRGAVTHIRQLFPKAKYTHCATHALIESLTVLHMHSLSQSWCYKMVLHQGDPKYHGYR